MILLVTILLVSLHYALGGNCWTTVNKNGRCQNLVQASVSQEECCTQFGGQVTAWSRDNLTSGKLFFYRTFGGGAPNCQSCQKTCKMVHCPESKVCVLRASGPRCVCDSKCRKSDRRGAVCGSDGRTYRNYCLVKKQRCRRRSKAHVEIEYRGRCRDRCKRVKCSNGKSCVRDQNMVPHCLACDFYCNDNPENDKAVCGSDAITYPSVCHVRLMSCKLGKSIPVAYTGRCNDSLTCSIVECGPHQKCLIDIRSGQPRCTTCNRHCVSTAVRRLCGVDGLTYSNYCDLRQSSCRDGIYVDVKHAGKCRKRGKKKRRSKQKKRRKRRKNIV